MSKNKIAVIIPSTSKNRNWESVYESYLYKTIQSFKNSSNNEYEFKFFIGVDYDDEYYNNGSNIAFYKNLGVNIEFIYYIVEKGHVTKMWNILAKKAYTEQFEYIFSCGDDIIFYEPLWINASVHVLKNKNNIGLTGPLSENTRIFTQCFVHRTHIDIFGFFFPEEIKNWFCDDWMTLIYSSYNYVIPHRCSNYGGTPRYDVAHVDNNDLNKLVYRDKLLLDKYLILHHPELLL